MKTIVKFELQELGHGYVLVQSNINVSDKDILSELQQAVSGRIEVLTYLDGAVMLMNEEALMNGMQAWVVQEDHPLYKYVPEHFVYNGDKILVGPVVLCKDDGESFLGFDSAKEIQDFLQN